MEIGNLLFGHSRGNYPIDRESFECACSEVFKALLDVVNCDGYGHYIGNNKQFLSSLGGFQCDLFEINPYYWGECNCGADEAGDAYHKETCSLVIPNFKYNIKDYEPIEIRWYKYPFRDSYSNIELSGEVFCSILEDCMNYIKNLKEF
jgi:hypothetical protein